MVATFALIWGHINLCIVQLSPICLFSGDNIYVGAFTKCCVVRKKEDAGWRMVIHSNCKKPTSRPRTRTKDHQTHPVHLDTRDWLPRPRLTRWQWRLVGPLETLDGALPLLVPFCCHGYFFFISILFFFIFLRSIYSLAMRWLWVWERRVDNRNHRIIIAWRLQKYTENK